MEKEEKRVDLKRHRKYEKKTPWNLLLKAAVILVLFYLISYGINVILDKQKEQESNTEIQVEQE